MEYEVILSGQAKEDFRKIVHHLLYEFGNEQAATNVINDMEDTITRLSRIAGSLKLCDEPGLRAAIACINFLSFCAVLRIEIFHFSLLSSIFSYNITKIL